MLLTGTGHQPAAMHGLPAGFNIPGDWRSPTHSQGVVDAGLEKATVGVALALEVDRTAAECVSGCRGRQPPFNQS
jgi:hypothetical protein